MLAEVPGRGSMGTLGRARSSAIGDLWSLGVSTPQGMALPVPASTLCSWAWRWVRD